MTTSSALSGRAATKSRDEARPAGLTNERLSFPTSRSQLQLVQITRGYHACLHL